MPEPSLEAAKLYASAVVAQAQAMALHAEAMHAHATVMGGGLTRDVVSELFGIAEDLKKEIDDV